MSALCPPGATTQAMARALPERLTNQPTLVLCHRYRAYRVLLDARLPSPRKLVVAHEFNLFKRWRRRLEYRLRGRTVQFAGVSAAVAAELAQTTGTAITLPNGIDEAQAARAQLPREQARDLLGINDRDPAFTIGVAGRLHPKKRPGLALDICTNWHTPPHLVFIGDGDLRTELGERARALDNQVTFSGFVPDARRAFPGLDALLITSSDVEAFGMVALEALAAGVPTVAPDIPGPASVLGDLGFYYPPDDQDTVPAAAAALQRVQSLSTDALAEWRRKAQHRVTEEFSIAATARRLKPFLHGDPSG